MLARKSIKQTFNPSEKVLALMQDYRHMTNEAIRVGLSNNASSLKKLSLLTYKQLKKYSIPSVYKLCAISKAVGILASRRKSIRRGHLTKDPYMKKPILVSCYSFKIVNGRLCFPLGEKQFEFIPLNKHTLRMLEDQSLKVRSFLLTETSLSLCIAKEVSELNDLTGAIGIDRNLRNLCVGNQESVTFYDMSKVVGIGETTKEVIKSFKRNDVRIRKRIFSKYGERKSERVKRIHHIISKNVVENALEKKKAIVFADIKNIGSMYRKGNGKGKDYRRQMNNHWHYGEIKRQIEYKAQWSGVPIIHLTKSETRGTSSNCYICGERLLSSTEETKKRQLWCKKCEKWFDRDLVAVMNISRRGWLRFSQSKGIGREAMVSEHERRDEPLIRIVDPMKLSSESKKGG